MNTRSFPQGGPVRAALRLALLGTAAAAALVSVPTRAALPIGNNPLYLISAKANVLIVLDNSNSMDESATGAAVGSNSSSSKSEIARGVIRQLAADYQGRINMGLMAYRQGTLADYHLHNTAYDASFSPGTFDPGWTGARASATNKRFRLSNPSSAGDFVHYNVALPMYSGSNLGNAFCYSSTATAANDFNNGENPLTGPWDSYRCFRSKTGGSDTLPTSTASETANGWGSYWFNSTFNPTDSDFAQGILDFGRYLTWNYVGRTWYVNSSPGRGFLHVPIKELDSTQAAAMLNKLACNVPGNPGACTSNGIANGGLTPIEGTLLTARDYFKGSWTNPAEGYTANCYPLPTSCGKNFVVLLTDGLPSVNQSGTTLSNPTQAIADAAAAAAALMGDKIETYVIGFALPYGTNPTTLDTIASAGGTTTAYNASSTASLQDAFNKIFDDIFKKTSSFGGVSQNSTSINTGSAVFQGRFNSSDWSGEIAAFRPQSNGAMTPLWSTSDAGKIAPAATRKVFTRVPGTGGVELKVLADLSSTQQTALATPQCSSTLTGSGCAQARINWLRGDQSQEAPTGPQRKRTKILGDFISSSPYFVKETNTLYAGANDGMLHAFNASTGEELFAYVPNAVYGKLGKLSNPTYSHEYLVDGDIAVSPKDIAGNKHILVGALGRGGPGLYALDVTSPSTFDASKVMWEFTDADMGLVMTKPFIAKLNNGKTAVIVGNGPNSSNERAVLFIIDITDGTLIKKIDTGAGSSSANNGLSTPRGWDKDGDGKVDLIYAGDLLGNLWKFDLTAGSASSWASSFTSGSSPAPMFTAVDASSKRQPITGMVGLGINPIKNDPNYGKVYVFFGTGRYLTTGDVSDASIQSWYGLVDDGAVIGGRSDLKERTIEVETTVSGSAARAFSKPAAGDMAGKKGWFVDLKSPSTGAQGERMIGEHKFFGTVLLASSMIPSTDICTPGGDGFLNAIDPFTGANLDQSYFDVNNDLAFTTADRIGADQRAVGSISPKNNLPSDAILVGNRLISSGTSGAVSSQSFRNPIRAGRIAWREVVRP